MHAQALNPHVVAGHRACLSPVWVPFLHLPFCVCLLHSTLFSPFSRLSSFVFFRRILLKWLGLGTTRIPPCQVYKVLDSIFSSLFSHRFLEWFLMDFGSIFGSLFGWVFIFWLSFFEHVFCIDFSLNFGWNLVSFLMFFWYLYRSHMQPSKSSKNQSFSNEFQWFHSSEKHDFWWFPWSFSIPVLALFFDAFWHRF